MFAAGPLLFADTSVRPLADQHEIRRFGPASTHNGFSGIDEFFDGWASTQSR